MILKNKKKIRIIIGSLNIGGTEKQLLEIINFLAKKNWEIELITLKEKGFLINNLNPKIKVTNLNIKSSSKITNLFLIFYKLFKIFKKDSKTLTHFFLPQAYIIGMLAAITASSKCNLIMSRRSLNLYQNKYAGELQKKIFDSDPDKEYNGALVDFTGQKINVRVLKVDILKNQIDLELVKELDAESTNSNNSTTINLIKRYNS